VDEEDVEPRCQRSLVIQDVFDENKRFVLH
jgi:hypothetical protein